MVLVKICCRIELKPRVYTSCSDNVCHILFPVSKRIRLNDSELRITECRFPYSHEVINLPRMYKVTVK